MPDLITIHIASRYPKRYCAPHELPEGEEYDPCDVHLHPEQPGLVKCRVKIRIDPSRDLMDVLAECRDLWSRLDHAQPIWIAGEDTTWVALLAKALSISEIREFQPAEGDE